MHFTVFAFCCDSDCIRCPVTQGKEKAPWSGQTAGSGGKSRKRSKKADKYITCDYCGAKIDTSRHTVCPQCGGAFGKDAEWHERHEVDHKAVQKGAQAGYEEQKEQYQQTTNGSRNSVKTIALLSAVILLAAAAASVSGYFAYQNIRNASDGIPDGYTEANYSFESPLLLDQDGVLVKLGKIYEKNYGVDSKAFQVEIITENHTDIPVLLSVRAASVNGEVENFLLSDSPIVQGGKPISRFLEFKKRAYPEIKEIGFVSLLVKKESGVPIAGVAQPFTAQTTAAYVPTPIEMRGIVAYQDDRVQVMLETKPNWKDSILQIKNTGAGYFSLETSGVIDGEEVYLFLHDDILPGSVGSYRLSDIFPTSCKSDARSVQIRIAGTNWFAQKVFDTEYLIIK